MRISLIRELSQKDNAGLSPACISSVLNFVAYFPSFFDQSQQTFVGFQRCLQDVFKTCLEDSSILL